VKFRSLLPYPRAAGGDLAGDGGGGGVFDCARRGAARRGASGSGRRGEERGAGEKMCAIWGLTRGVLCKVPSSNSNMLL